MRNLKINIGNKRGNYFNSDLKTSSVEVYDSFLILSL